MEKVRKPTVAGQFYDGNRTDLEQSIRECFLDKRGPGQLPQIKDDDKTVKLQLEVLF